MTTNTHCTNCTDCTGCREVSGGRNLQNVRYPARVIGRAMQAVSL